MDSQWLMLAVLVLVAVAAAGALGWLIGHRPETDGPGQDSADDSGRGPGDETDPERSGGRPRKGSRKRKAGGSALIATPTFAPVTTPTASSQQDGSLPDGNWSPPSLPEEYAATVINVAPINEGVMLARTAPTPVRPEDMEPAVRVPRAASQVPPPAPAYPTPPHPAGPRRVPAPATAPSHGSADPRVATSADQVSANPISATSINELRAISAVPDPISPDAMSAAAGSPDATTDDWGWTEPTSATRMPNTDEFDHLTPEELRERLTRAQVEMGRIEAVATAAWDRTVPALEDQITDLQLANARLEARLSAMQQARGGEPEPSGQRRKPANKRGQQLSSVDGRS